MSAGDYLYNVSARFLKTSQTYVNWCNGIGSVIETFKTRYTDSVRQSIISKCSNDSLVLWGKLYNVEMLPNETYSNFRTRLINGIRSSDYQGSFDPIFQVLTNFNCSGTIIRQRKTTSSNSVLYTSSVANTTEAAFVEGPDSDSYSGGYYKWNRFVIFIYPNSNNLWKAGGILYPTRTSLVSNFATVGSYTNTGKTMGYSASPLELASFTSEIRRVIPVHISSSDWSAYYICDDNAALLGIGTDKASNPFASQHILKLH